MNFLTDFGVKPLLLAAQAVNFLLLLYILKRVLYKPILKVLDERKQKIAQSLKDVLEIEARLKETGNEQDRRLKAADNQAKLIIEDASKAATLVIEQAHLKASKDIEQFTLKAQAAITFEREKLQQEIKEQVADLVIISLEKVIGKVLTSKDKKDLIQKSIQELQ